MDYLRRLARENILPIEAVDIAQCERDPPSHGTGLRVLSKMLLKSGRDCHSRATSSSLHFDVSFRSRDRAHRYLTPAIVSTMRHHHQ